MPRGQRVEWTDFEQETLFAAVTDLARQQPGISLVKAMQMAQVSIHDARRRRKITSISNIPIGLRNRFIQVGLLARDWEKQLRRVRKDVAAPQEDPRDARIRDLEAEVTKLREELRDAEVEVRELRNRPTPTQLIQTFIADTLALALQKSRAVPGPGLTPVAAAFAAAARPHKHEEQRPQPRDIVFLGVPLDRRPYYERIFNGRARLRFWVEGHSLATLQDYAKRADMTFIRQDVIEAQSVDAVRAVTDKFQRVAGPEPRMSEEADSWLKRAATQQQAA